MAYKQCGRLEEKLKNPEVAASFYHEAALCFQKDDPQGVTARRGSTVLSSITESAVTANFSFFGATLYLYHSRRVVSHLEDHNGLHRTCKLPADTYSSFHLQLCALALVHPHYGCCHFDLEATACYLSAINLFCQKQRFSTAARLECEVAELMQNDR